MVMYVCIDVRGVGGGCHRLRGCGLHSVLGPECKPQLGFYHFGQTAACTCAGTHTHACARTHTHTHKQHACTDHSQWARIVAVTGTLLFSKGTTTLAPEHAANMHACLRAHTQRHTHTTKSRADPDKVLPVGDL